MDAWKNIRWVLESGKHSTHNSMTKAKPTYSKESMNSYTMEKESFSPLHLLMEVSAYLPAIRSASTFGKLVLIGAIRLNLRLFTRCECATCALLRWNARKHNKKAICRVGDSDCIGAIAERSLSRTGHEQTI